MTARDRIVILFVAVFATMAASWQLVIKPQRTKAAELKTMILRAQSDADSASSLASQATVARAQYARDYASLVKLGRAVPVDDDVASLVYLIDVSARQAGIDFRSVNVAEGPGQSAAPAPAAASGASANAAKAPAEADAGASEQQLAGGVTQVPVSMSFEGGFFAMTRFLSTIERYTLAGPGSVAVRGRLVSIDSVTIEPSVKGFPMVTAEVTASAYRAPINPVDPAAETLPAQAPAPAGQPSTAAAAASTPAPASATQTPPAAAARVTR